MAIGERLPMLGAGRRARGSVPYVLNQTAPGALAGAIARSQRPHARLLRVDASRALKVPGVVAVVTRDDFLGDERLSPYFGAVERDQPILALDRVRYVGEPIAAVAAEDTDAAAEAATLIQIGATYQELEPVFEAGRAAPLLHDDKPGNVAATYTFQHGDVAVGMAAAERVLEGVYTTPSVQHVSLEPHVTLARFEPSGQLVIESATQTPHHLRRQLAAARAVDWDQPRPVLASGERVGRGVAVVMKTTSTPSTSSATVKLNEDGSLDVLTSSVEMGQGASTVLAQIAAERAGVDVRKVHVSDVDTDSTPYDQSTSSSRTTFVMGRAISDAVEEVNAQLRELAGKSLEAAPGDIELAAGRAQVRGVPDRSVEYGALVRGARRGNLLGQAVYTSTAKPDPETGGPGVSAHYHQAVGAAEVAVDPETGRVRVLRLHAAVFAGRAINPTLCELQTEGSAIFGLGQALFEAIHQDGGQVSNANLGDYLILAFGDLPARIEASIHEEPGHDEVHGIGEVAAPVAPPAIGNAIADAVGSGSATFRSRPSGCCGHSANALLSVGASDAV